MGFFSGLWDFMLSFCDAGMKKVEKEYNANRLDDETYDKLQSDYSRIQEKREESREKARGWDEMFSGKK